MGWAALSGDQQKRSPCDSKSLHSQDLRGGGRPLALSSHRDRGGNFLGASSEMLVLKLALKVPPSSSFPDFSKILPTQFPVESLCAQMSWSHHHLKQTLAPDKCARDQSYTVPEDIRSMDSDPEVSSVLAVVPQCPGTAQQNCPVDTCETVDPQHCPFTSY